MNFEKVKQNLNLFKSQDFDHYIPIEYIIIHHSATEDSPEKNAIGIKKYHTSYRINGEIVTEEEFNRRLQQPKGGIFEFPWKDVGYNYLLEKVNDKLVLFLGRPLTMPGAHCLLMNNKSIGICLVGNYDEEEPELEKLDYLAVLCKTLMDCFNIKLENVLGHREANIRNGIFNTKSCPGLKFNMNEFKNRIALLNTTINFNNIEIL